LKWKKHINIVDARKLSKLFCNDFKLPYCQIYYVDVLEGGSYGIYCEYTPPHILMIDYTMNSIGILIHELNHHLVARHYAYENEFSSHGYPYQLAKIRVIKWCYHNISKKADWSLPLKAYQTEINMRKFRV